MPAVGGHHSPNSLTCSRHERVTKLLLLPHPCFGFATEPSVVVGIIRSVVPHRDAVADQLHMAGLFSRNGGDQTVEGAELALAAEVATAEVI